jgi:hypothetical protein
MDALSMDLVTKVVILATALVGLYKAATFGKGKPPSTTESDESPQTGRRVPSTFSALFELVGMLLFMLAFPAFIWAFSLITKSMSGSSSTSPAQKPAVAISIDSATSPAELAYVAANAISNTHDRTTALKGVVDFALKRGEFKTAITAAAAIPNSYDQAAQLTLVAQALRSPPPPSKGASAP